MNILIFKTKLFQNKSWERINTVDYTEVTHIPGVTVLDGFGFFSFFIVNFSIRLIRQGY